jgi:MFS family permease
MSRQKRLLLAVLCGVLFLEGLDVSLVGVALPSIKSDLGLSDAQLQWVVSASGISLGLVVGGLTTQAGWRLALILPAPVAALLPLAAVREGKPSVGLEPTTPSLPWKGTGSTSVHERSHTGTKSLQSPTMWGVRPWCPICARSRSSGRGVDALHSPARLPNLQG